MLPHDRGGALQVDAGDLIVVPQGETHVLGSSTELSPESLAPLLANQVETAPGEVMTLAYGGGGVGTRMVCGFLAAQHIWRNPLLSALPRLFKVGMRGSRAAWLETSLRFATEEAASAHAGSATVLAKLSELLFVEAARRYVDTMPDDSKGWLAGLRDRFVARALALRRASGPWKTLPGGPACRVPGSHSVSRACFECRRCNTWRSGDCNSPPSNFASPIGRSRQSRRMSVTNPKPHSIARSSGSSARHRRHGAGTPPVPPLAIRVSQAAPHRTTPRRADGPRQLQTRHAW